MANTAEQGLSRDPVVYPISDGCALQGAQSVVHWIDNSIPLLHTSPGCGFNFDFSGSLLAGQCSGPRWGGYVTPCTELVEKDVVFGGEEKLYQELINIPQIYKDLEMVTVLTGCTADIIADDVERVIQRAKADMNGIEVLNVSSGGYRGMASFGSDLTINEICKKLVAAPKKKRKNTVNIIGIIPYWNPFWIGDKDEIKRICNLLGIEINAILPGECTVQNIREMAEAELNIVFSDHVGVEAARIMEEKFETPFIVAEKGFPVGAKGTKEFFMDVVHHLSLDTKKAEAILNEEVKRFYKIFALHAESWVWFGNMDYALISPSTKALGLIRFLTGELDYYPVLIGLTEFGENSISALEKTLKEVVPKSIMIPEANRN